jgi:hypothetical protein
MHLVYLRIDPRVVLFRVQLHGFTFGLLLVPGLDDIDGSERTKIRKVS